MVDLPPMPDFDDSIFDEAAEEILAQGGYTPDFLTSPKGSALINETNRILQTALDEGLSQRVDPDFRAHLEQNIFIFSGFKTHAELEQVNNLLRDSDGNIVPFDKFKYEVTKLGKKVNHAHLQAEYNMAVQSAQMASKWKDFEKHKDIANLQYRTANDEKVRAEHAALNGITLPFDDKFWNNYYPPLGWNCRCTVVEVLKDRYPETNTNEAIKAGEFATSKPAQKIFRFNPGKVEKIFPPKHPYFPKGCGECKKGLGANNLAYSPDNILCKACNVIRKLFNKECESKKRYDQNKADYEKFKNDPNYKNVKFNPDNGALMATHKGRKNHSNEKTLIGYTPTQLEDMCQLQIFNLGGRCIIRNEKTNAPMDNLHRHWIPK